MNLAPRSLGRLGAAFALCLSASLACNAAVVSDSAVQNWPEVATAQPAAGEARAALVWLDGAPDDADAAADLALLADPAVREALSAFAPHRLSWPAGGVQNPAALSRHAALADRWAIEQLPAWVLLDPTGRMFARFDEGTPLAGSPAAAAARLDAALERLARRDALLEAAAGAEGLQRATLLGQALEQVEEFAVPDHAEVIEEILRLDPEDATGLRSRWFLAWSEPRVEARIGTAVFPLIDLGQFEQARTALLLVRDAEPLPAELARRLDVFAAQLRQSAGDLPAARTPHPAVINLTPAGPEADAYRELLSTMTSVE